MMKNLKYIISLLMLGSMGIGFLSLISFGNYKVSTVDVIKIAFTENKESGIIQKIIEMGKNYIKDYAYMALLLLGLIALAAILTAVLPGMAAYIVSLVGQISVTVIAGILYTQVEEKITAISSTINKVTGFLRLGGIDEIGVLEVHKLPLVLWAIIYVITFILAILGCCSQDSYSRKKRERI